MSCLLLLVPLVGAIVYHSDRLPGMNTVFQLPAADNDPCDDGLAEARIVTGPSTETCGNADQSHYMQPVRRRAQFLLSLQCWLVRTHAVEVG